MVKEGTSRGDTATNLHNFSSRIFLVPVKNSKILFGELQAENMVNTGPGSHDNFFGNAQNHENVFKWDPYSTSRAENQGF